MLRKMLLVSACAAGLTSVAFAGGLPEELPPAPVACDSGLYLGVEGGWGITNWKNLEARQVINVNNDNGFVGRALLGYDINKYFAVEGGYTYFFFKPKLSLASVDLFRAKNSYAVDLVGKIKAPIVDNFDLYAKLGADYYVTNVETLKAGVRANNYHSFNVIYGAGADYYITPNVIANVEWLRFNGNPSLDFTTKPLVLSKYQPYADTFMLGLRYKFDM